MLKTTQTSNFRRVAIIHYWLVGMRGGERVLESLCKMFPNADIFTHVVEHHQLSDLLQKHTIKTTFIDRLPFAKKLYQSYLPLMPMALEGLDLSDYDLVISSEAGPAKGVVVPPGVPHVCYCHSPMRYLWDQYSIYRKNAGTVTRLAMPWIAHKMRLWDVTSAARVDHFVANSNHVANRIEKYYRRDAAVVAPPVAVSDFSPVPLEQIGDFYLWAGELAPYKRPDLAIEAFNRSGRKLVVIGGPAKTVEELRRKAKPNVTFLGKAPFPVLKDHMARCRGLIFPGEEDFGIVPVEVMASGRPVVAFAKGGALDTVIDGLSGILFPEQSVESMNEAIDRMEEWIQRGELDVDAIRQHAERFSEANFQQAMMNEISSALESLRPNRILGSCLAT